MGALPAEAKHCGLSACHSLEPWPHAAPPAASFILGLMLRTDFMPIAWHPWELYELLMQEQAIDIVHAPSLPVL